MRNHNLVVTSLLENPHTPPKARNRLNKIKAALASMDAMRPEDHQYVRGLLYVLKEGPEAIVKCANLDKRVTTKRPRIKPRPAPYTEKCELRPFLQDGHLHSLWITFKGEVAKFPSTSNSKQIYRGKNGRRFIGKNQNQLARLAEMDRLYLNTADSRLKNLSFGKHPVQVLILLCKYGRRVDSHNIPKTIGDWLQHIKLIDDDTHAEIFCIKRSEYSSIGNRLARDHYPTFLEGDDVSSIVIQRRSPVLQRLHEEHIIETIKLSTGRYTLIG